MLISIYLSATCLSVYRTIDLASSPKLRRSGAKISGSKGANNRMPSTSLAVDHEPTEHNFLRSPSPSAEGDSRGFRKRLSFSRAKRGFRSMFKVGDDRETIATDTCKQGQSSKPVLEYYDVCLRQEDIENYKANNWLQDSNIEFFFTSGWRGRSFHRNPRGYH